MSNNNTYLFAGVSILIAVILGAMGAHYLKETLAYPIDKIESWKTGNFYQLTQSLALLLLVLIANGNKAIQLGKAIVFIKIGVILFSGSIYILTLNYSWNNNLIPKIAGPLTPIGGFCLIIGWALFILAIYKSKQANG